MIAALYDVHGNLPALEAVLADAEAAGASRYWLGGDYALMGGWPAETLDRLNALGPEVMIRGNVERWVARPGDAPDDTIRAAVADCRRVLGDRTADALGALPTDAVAEDWHVVHASPENDMDGLLPQPRDDEARLLARAQRRRLLVGHTHVPFRREAQGLDVVNPGSVGIPLDGDHRASYALLRPDGGVEHRRVEYDWRASAQRIRDAFPGAAWVEMPAGRIERARL